jgi:hypothetical protein
MRDWGRLRASLFKEGVISDYHQITEDERNGAVCAGALADAIGIVLYHAPSFVFTDGKAFYQGLGTMLGETVNGLMVGMEKVEQQTVGEQRARKDKA